MDPIEISAISMKNDLIKLDNISNNIANLTTPAYKKSVAFTESLSANMQAAQSRLSQGNFIGESFSLPVVKTLHDQSTAALKQSSNPLDLAIEGNAYFELQNLSGTVYSKRGNFILDSDGRILLSGTQAYLRGLGGDIRINSNPEIDSLGRIFDEGKQVEQIKLVRFANPQNLVSIGNGLFTNSDQYVTEVIDKAIVRQGFLEASNAQPAEEMINLIQLTKRIEATQQVIRGYDGMLETALDDLGNF